MRNAPQGTKMDGRISNFMQIASLRRYEMTEGTERGLRILDCDNGRLRFLLNESKALDMMQLFDRGMNVSFISKNGFTAREIPFSKRFEGGMLYTVGLDSAGAREGFEVHGSFHNLPARVSEAVCNEKGIRIAAEIEDTELFGKNLVMRRVVTSALGSDSVTISDTLENRGTRAENYCLLYHVNIGYPFLDDGVKILSDAEDVIPRTHWAELDLKHRTTFRAQAENEEERCFFVKNKTPHIEAVNERLGRKVVLDYSGDTLPCLVQWNSNAAGDYALGLEPCTGYLDERFRYNVLPPRCNVRFFVTVSVRDLK